MNKAQKEEVKISIDEALADLEFEYDKAKIHFNKTKKSMLTLNFIIKTLRNAKDEL
jgi:hypothetical protein